MQGAQTRHVVILDENLPVPLDRRVWLEARALADAGWSVSIIAPRRAARGMSTWVERLDGVLILRYPQRAASGLAGYLVEYLPSMVFTLIWLLALRLRGPIDVIHACNPPDLFFLLGWLGRLWGARFVFDQHDANPELAEAKWGASRLGPLLIRLTLALERASYRAASLVIVPNEGYAEIARVRGHVPDDNIALVRNAPRVAEFANFAAGILPPPTPFRIGYLGVMGSQDGVELLIEAIAELRRDTSVPVEAHLVGDGERRPDLEALAADLGLDDVVHFHGYQGPEVFVPILAGCHVCVSPDPVTAFNDVSTMTKVVEYLAIGRPVVAFALSETRRLIGSAGEIVEPDTPAALARAFSRLAHDRNALDVVATPAQSRFADLDMAWEVSAERLVRAYAGLGHRGEGDRAATG